MPGSETEGTSSDSHESSSSRKTNSSYYSFDGTPYSNRIPNAATYMKAEDARSQQNGVPDYTGKGYPTPFYNREQLFLSSPGGPWLVAPGAGRGTPGAGRGTPGAGRGTPGAGRGTPGAGRGTPGAGRGTAGAAVLLHYPLTPGTDKTYTSGPPGAVRSAYIQGDPANFGVMFHKTKSGSPAKRDDPFVEANYYPAKREGKKR